MTSSILFTNAQLIDGSIVDVATDHGTIAWIGPTDSSPVVSNQKVNLNGYVLSSSFVEPHAHLDKAFLADRISNPAGDLMGAIRGLEQVRGTITHEDLVERATRAVHLMSQNGVTSIRTHADTTISGGLSSIHALLEVKKNCQQFHMLIHTTTIMFYYTMFLTVMEIQFFMIKFLIGLQVIHKKI